MNSMCNPAGKGPEFFNVRKLLWLVLLMLAAGCARQTTYPDRPILLICPWSAGGGTDQIARQLAFQLEQEMGVPVNVINATGGAGVTGHTRGALSRPDGYNMTLLTAEINMLHWRGLTNITWEDYQPLMKVNQDFGALFVRNDAPWQTLKELEQAIRENPGRLRGAGTAFGGVWHVSLAGWLLAADLPADAVTWISINGSGPSLQELMAGGVDMVVVSPAEARTLYEAGEIRMLGVMSDERLAGHPDIPTFREEGYDWTSQTWRGLAVPKGIQAEPYEVLLESVEKVLRSDEFQRFLAQSGFGVSNENRDEYLEFLEKENRTYGEILQSAAFQAVVSQKYGPMLFPYLILGGIGLILIILGSWGELRLVETAGAIMKEGYASMAWMAGAVIAYLLLAELLGFIITAGLILLLLLLVNGTRWSTALLIVFILVPLCYQIFAVYLRVPLPWGLLGW